MLSKEIASKIFSLLPQQKYSYHIYEYDWKDKPKIENRIEIAIVDGGKIKYATLSESMVFDDKKLNKFINWAIEKFESNEN